MCLKMNSAGELVQALDTAFARIEFEPTGTVLTANELLYSLVG